MKNGLMILPVLTITVMAGACGCTRTADNSGREEARALYEESLVLIDLYTDSVTAAKDSATLNGLMSRYREEIDDLNFRHPPETSYAISEGGERHPYFQNLTDGNHCGFTAVPIRASTGPSARFRGRRSAAIEKPELQSVSNVISQRTQSNERRNTCGPVEIYKGSAYRTFFRGGYGFVAQTYSQFPPDTIACCHHRRTGWNLSAYLKRRGNFLHSMIGVESGCQPVGDIVAGVKRPPGIGTVSILRRTVVKRICGEIGSVKVFDEPPAQCCKLRGRDENRRIESIFKLTETIARATEFFKHRARIKRFSGHILVYIKRQTYPHSTLISGRDSGSVDRDIDADGSCCRRRSKHSLPAAVECPVDFRTARHAERSGTDDSAPVDAIDRRTLIFTIGIEETYTVAVVQFRLSLMISPSTWVWQAKPCSPAGVHEENNP